MRVGFIIHDMFHLGAQAATAKLANGMVAKGMEVDVVVSGIHAESQKANPNWNPMELDARVKFIGFKPRRASRSVWALCRYLRQNKPNTIIVMSSQYLAPAVVAAQLVRTRTKVIYVEHLGDRGKIGYKWSRAFGRKVLLKIASPLVNWSWRNVDHIVAVSSGVAEVIKSNLNVQVDKVTIIPNPVINDTFHSQKRQPATHRWLRNKRVPVVMAAGSHIAVKGYETLIKAFSMVCKEIDAKLIIYGEGELTKQYKELAKELDIEKYVDFPGYSHNLPSNLKEADVFVVSSEFESFSIVLVEALACGVPVISTDCKYGPSEILCNGKFGSLVPVGDAEGLAREIMVVLHRRVTTIRNEGWKSYDVDSIIDQYMNVIYQL